MSQRVTIQDVANLAGVSKVTVSYVLNGRDVDARISGDTRQRVLDAARMLDYRPSAIARTLATRRSQSIAIVFQYASFFSHWSSFISEIMHGVCEAAVERDFDLLLHTRRAESTEAEISMLTDGRADGVLLLRDGNDPLVNEIFDRQVPSVLFFTRSYHAAAAFVDADNYAGGRIATQHLVDLGHRRIGMVRGGIHSVSSNDRFNGYRDVLEGAKLPVDPRHHYMVPTPDDPLDDIVQSLQSAEAPTALFVWSDDVAFRLMRTLQSAGLRVPEDISVVGFDSLDQCNLSSPRLTSVRQPIPDMARDATNLLVDMIQKEPVKWKQRIYPLQLDVRASTAPPPKPFIS